VQDDGAKVPLLESEQQYILHCSSTAAQSALASASYHYPRASYNTIFDGFPVAPSSLVPRATPCLTLNHVFRTSLHLCKSTARSSDPASLHYCSRHSRPSHRLLPPLEYPATHTDLLSRIACRHRRRRRRLLERPLR
jgi:hypothetical protein